MKLHLCFYLIEAIYLYKKIYQFIIPWNHVHVVNWRFPINKSWFWLPQKKKKGKEKLILSWGVSFGALSAFYICLNYLLPSEVKPKELENIFIYIVGGEEEPPHRFMTATARWGDLTSPFDIRFQILIIQQMRKKFGLHKCSIVLLEDFFYEATRPCLVFIILIYFLGTAITFL
jgi:hypothetical protein